MRLSLSKRVMVSRKRDRYTGVLQASRMDGFWTPATLLIGRHTNGGGDFGPKRYWICQRCFGSQNGQAISEASRLFGWLFHVLVIWGFRTPLTWPFEVRHLGGQGVYYYLLHLTVFGLVMGVEEERDTLT